MKEETMTTCQLEAGHWVAVNIRSTWPRFHRGRRAKRAAFYARRRAERARIKAS
jgi:hypothetical protein